MNSKENNMREIKFRAWTGSRMISFNEVVADGLSPMATISIDNIPLTWLQFTGLKDKNGKEIYEGDLIKQLDAKGKRQGYVCIVDWREYQAGFHPFVGARVPEGRWEVIGNIHENPELLKP